jgi:hypothetical protein
MSGPIFDCGDLSTVYDADGCFSEALMETMNIALNGLAAAREVCPREARAGCAQPAGFAGSHALFPHRNCRKPQPVT